MIDGKNSLTLLTGATSGIGLELAKRLILTDDLVVIGRKSESEVNALISDKIQYIQISLLWLVFWYKSMFDILNYFLVF